MRGRIASAVIVACAAAAVLWLIYKHQTESASGVLPHGHGIKCLKADGSTPCGDPDIASLNLSLAGLKQLGQAAKTVASDTKSLVSDTQGAVSDAKQVGSDGQQVASDVKQVGTDVKNGDLKQAVSDAKQTGSDTKSAVSDTKTAAADPQQVGSDAKQTVKDLQGIASLSLKSPDGAMNCAQNDGSACNDNQTKALQTHAAQMTPSITVKREVDQASN
jgi:hypothetical protein